MIASERLRVTILAAIAGALLLELSVATIAIHRAEFVLPGNVSPAALGLVLLAIIVYALLVRRWLDRLAPTARLGLGMRYASAALEASLPSLTIYAVARLLGPGLALSSPAVLLYCMLLILSVLRLEPWLCIFTAFVGAAQYLGLALVFTPQHDLALPHGMPPIAPHLGRAGMLFACGVVAALVAARTRRRLRDSVRMQEEHSRVLGVFGQHVSPAVADALVASRIEQHGELRIVCVMFLDIRGFTRFAERRAPTDVVTFLDAVFAPMITIVGRHRGIINKFLGDGFMAVFGAPLPAEAPARDAVAAAREILAGITAQIAAGTLPPTRIGIGLHVGEALTGTIGSTTRKEYTIIGDVVNLAARIEQLNKTHGSQLLVSDSVAAELGEQDLHTIGEVAVPGRDAPVKLVRLA